MAEKPICECVYPHDKSWKNKYRNRRVTPPIPDNAEAIKLAADLLKRGLENHGFTGDLMDVFVDGYQQKRMEEWAREDLERAKRNAQIPASRKDSELYLDQSTRASMSTHNFMQQCYRHQPNI